MRAQRNYCNSERSAFFALRSLLRSEESASLFFSANLSILCVSALSFSFSLRSFAYILTSLPLYLVFSLPRHRRLCRFVVFPFRHPLIIRRGLFQQFLSRFHLRAPALIAGNRLIVLISAGVCCGCAFARRSPLVACHFSRRLLDARLVCRSFTRRRESFIAPQRFPRQRLELLQARQLLQIAQSKPHQKLFQSLVQDRPPHHFLPPRCRDQALVQQRADHARRVHTAYLRNFRSRHRLLVRDHRQRFQRRHRKPQRRPQALDKPPHHVMLLRLGVQLVSARHRANLDPALFGRIARHQFIQRSLHRQLFLAQRLRQLLDCSRLVRRINNRFQRRFSLFVSHRLFLPFFFGSAGIPAGSFFL